MNLLKNLQDNLFKSKKNIYFLLLALSFFSRSIISYYYGDTSLENEWRILVGNLYNNNTLSMLQFGDLLVPNLWMPPVYAYFIYIHALIVGLNENLASCVIITQVILSSLTTLLFHRIISNFFSLKISLFGSIIFCFFPLIVYSSSQISSATLYLFLLLSFVLLILNLDIKRDSQKFWNLALIGFLSGILILTRRDFILIYLFSLFYSFFFFKTKLKQILIIALVTSITISPYITRNYISFEKFIVHSGLGYNLWKAYNVNAKVEGFYNQSSVLKEEIKKVKKDIYYRINEDKIYFDFAKKYIIENPFETLKLFLKRLFSFFFIDLDSSQKYYYNIFHILPNASIAAIALLGLIVCKKKDTKFNYLLFTLIAILLIYSLFALLPRYKLYILPFQIILSLKFLEFITHKLRKNN